MDDTNPQIEAALDGLAELVCESLQGDQPTVGDRSEGLLKTLLMSGYDRKSKSSLMMDIENRVKDRCREPAMHRGGALSSISKQLSDKFQDLARWESKTPDDKSPPKAANISAATDS